MKLHRLAIFAAILVLLGQTAIKAEEITQVQAPDADQTSGLEHVPQPIALETAGLERAEIESRSGEPPKAVPYRPKTDSDFPKVKVFKDFASTPILVEDEVPPEEAYQPEKASKFKDVVRGTVQFLKDATRVSVGAHA